MFDINLITDPGIQKESSSAFWSYLHKKQENSPKKKSSQKSASGKNIFSSWKVVILATLFIYSLVFLGIRQENSVNISADMVLNQVIDLIVESGYMKDLKLSHAEFGQESVHVTIRAKDLQLLQDFSRGYRKEDNIPYHMYKRDNQSFVNLMFPWEGNKAGGDIQVLRTLAGKTVFSNKISIHFTDHQFELQGRSSDIISYLLQMAESDMIQKFTFSVRHLESGRYILKVNTHQI